MQKGFAATLTTIGRKISTPNWMAKFPSNSDHRYHLINKLKPQLAPKCLTFSVETALCSRTRGGRFRTVRSPWFIFAAAGSHIPPSSSTRSGSSSRRRISSYDQSHLCAQTLSCYSSPFGTCFIFSSVSAWSPSPSVLLHFITLRCAWLLTMP